MKINLVCLMFATLVALTVPLPAQETVPSLVDTTAAATAPAAEAMPWQLGLIAVLSPLIVAGVKWLFPKIPGGWLPVIAPAAGLAIDLIAHFTAGTVMTPGWALAAGLTGVGLRELVDQGKKAAGARGDAEGAEVKA